jgi:hypothetical protein
MGYTQYWARPQVLPRPQFVAAVEDCRRLCAALNIPLGDGNGQGQPIFSSSMICFNGHVNSKKFCSSQQTEGLVWPRSVTCGVAVIGESDAVAGGFFSGVTARILGPDGDGSYETFLFTQVHRLRHPMEETKDGWCQGFCKTCYRPYDLCVQSCLMVLSHHFGKPSFRVDSDGTSEQWNEARHACQQVLGYGSDWGEGRLAPV